VRLDDYDQASSQGDYDPVTGVSGGTSNSGKIYDGDDPHDDSGFHEGLELQSVGPRRSSGGHAHSMSLPMGSSGGGGMLRVGELLGTSYQQQGQHGSMYHR
jgi:hypothetical protein